MSAQAAPQSFASSSVGDLVAMVAAKRATPGGGAVAGVCGALGAALANMAVAYSIGKKDLAAHQPALLDAQSRLTRAAALFLTLADEDAAAYALMNELQKLPEQDPRRVRELPGATRAGTQIPLAVAAAACDALRLMQSLAPITNRHLRSDLAIGAVLAEGTARAARWNVLVNLPALPEAERAAAARQIEDLVKSTRDLASRIEQACV